MTNTDVSPSQQTDGADLPTFVLVLGTADWDQPIATNQHYVTREIAAGGDRSVDFVESIALRTPRLSVADLRRIAKRLGRVLTPTQAVPGRHVPVGLRVLSPLIVPLHRGAVRAINRQLLHRTAADWITYAGPKVLWSYSPLTYGLENLADATVYHCVDLLGTVPGIDPRVVRRGEQRLADHGALAIATSTVVRDHLVSAGFSSPLLWTNVADTSVFHAADPESSQRVGRRVVFAGNLVRRKVDFELMLELAANGFEVIVAGPTDDGGAETASILSDLQQGGVSYAGMLRLPELAELFATATVGLIPYKLNAYTRGVSPLKTFEYAASGLAVVSTRLPGVEERDGFVWVAERERFLDAVIEADASMSPDAVATRIEISRAQGWDERGRSIRLLLDEMTSTAVGR